MALPLVALQELLGPPLDPAAIPTDPQASWVVCTDSRQLMAGQLFVPLVGESFDGHSFVANAIEANGCTDKLVLVAGDAHMLAFDDGANSNYASTGSSNSKGFPVVCPPRRMMHTP